MIPTQQSSFPPSMSFLNFPGQTLQKPKDPYQESLPSWSKFEVKRFSNSVRYTAGVIMDHYLVFLAHDYSSHPRDRSGVDDYDSEDDEPATLFAFNLLDHSIQQAEIKSSLFAYQDGYYRFLKYGENQIIKYGGRDSDYSPSSFVCITVESFEPFKVKCEEIKDELKGRFTNCTAQIYKECLYVYGRTRGIWGREPSRNELWSFHNGNWQLCEMNGEVPEFEYHNYSDIGPSSFIFQDNLYVYGIVKNKSPCGDLFMLDFNSMKWTKIEQPEKYLEHCDDKERTRSGGTVYKDYLVALKQAINSSENMLCFLDLNTKNTWSTFDIQGINERDFNSHTITGDLMIYKNLVISLATVQCDRFLNVVMMNMEKFSISAPKSAEDELISQLFMNETGSNITFKVEEELIPGHKEVLVKKSRYFEGLFKSGMAESKQDVIKIEDCQAETFKEYLRWIYQGTISLESEDLAMKLYTLSDKYIQEDLREKCLHFLTENLKINNVYTVLDFAHQGNIFQIKIWCIKFFKDNLNLDNIAGLIEYLSRQEDQEFKENNKELRDLALNFVLNKFWRIQKDDLAIYQDFLIRNIEMDTLPALARFLGPPDEYNKKAKVAFEEIVGRLKEAVFSFIQENIQSIMESQIRKEFSNGFFSDFTLYLATQIPKSEKKRMEPSQGDYEEGGDHELKKTKKSDITN